MLYYPLSTLFCLFSLQQNSWKDFFHSHGLPFLPSLALESPSIRFSFSSENALVNVTKDLLIAETHGHLSDISQVDVSTLGTVGFTLILETLSLLGFLTSLNHAPSS